MKFDFIWPSGFWENYVLIYWWTPIWATLAESSKVNLDLWNLFIDTRMNISSENNDFGFHSIQKINFAKKNPI